MDRTLFEERQNPPVRAIEPLIRTSGEIAESALVIVHCQRDLLDIVPARHATSGFTSGLNSGQEKPNKNANDGDHHEQFNERETTP